MTLLLAEAVQRIVAGCVPVEGILGVPLGAAQSRVLGESVVAPIDVPAADNSAVDGYGFRHGDLIAAGREGLSVVSVAAAGHPLPLTVRPGEAVRIFTGAIPPGDVDAIAMQEEAILTGGRLFIRSNIPHGGNIRRKGEDISAGSTVLAQGRCLGPFELGMLASLGIAEARVRPALRVAVLSAGDELIDPGLHQAAGAIYDANRPLLIAMLSRMGFAVTDLGIVKDNRVAIERALEEAASAHDAIVTSAGVSVGDEDHLRRAIGTLGALDFAGVAIKPGKPFAFGQVRGAPIFALPGNPAAMIVTFLMLARPGLARLAGARRRPPPRFSVTVDFSLGRRSGLREFLRCSLCDGPDGPVAVRHPRGGSGILSSMSETDGFVELAEDVTTVSAGTRMPFIPFSAFGL